jgi:hypothetical protein
MWDLHCNQPQHLYHYPVGVYMDDVGYNFLFSLSYLSPLFTENGDFGSFFNLESPFYIFLLSFNLNKLFSQQSRFFFCVCFIISLSKCDIVLFGILCSVIWFPICIVVLIWFLLKYRFQRITDSINDLNINIVYPKT